VDYRQQYQEAVYVPVVSWSNSPYQAYYAGSATCIERL
jgi:hypothetical protein